MSENEVATGSEFFLVICGGKDELAAVNWDGNQGFQTLPQAAEYAKDNAFDGAEYMVFRCTPIKHVNRGPVRVNDYSPPKSSRKAASAQ